MTVDLSQGAGRYRLLRRLGEGGMGEIYLAEAQGLDGVARKVAIKVVRQLHKRRDRLVSLFVDEARVSFLLNHPNIIQTYDIGQVEGDTFLVLEYVDGGNLELVLERLREMARPMPVPLALYIASQVARGLEYAHSYVDDAGHIVPIIHRDISPGNVLISRRGQVKIADFGLAKSALRTVKSDHNTIKGKIAYMPMEQLYGRDVDARADIYSLGVILYEMIAGAHPFGDAQRIDYLDRLAQKKPPPPLDKRAAVSSHLAELVATCMAKAKEDRFSSTREVVRLIDQHLRDVGADAPEFDLADLMSQILETPAPSEALAGEASLFDQALGLRLERVENKEGLATFLFAKSKERDDKRAEEEIEDEAPRVTTPDGGHVRLRHPKGLSSPDSEEKEDFLALTRPSWPLWLAAALFLLGGAGAGIWWWLAGGGS